MKPEFKIEGREATPAEYAELMHALLASQAATPTARACTTADAPPVSMLDALLQAEASPAPAHRSRLKDGERGVNPRVSGFLEARDSISSVSAAPARATPGGFE